MYRSGSGLPIAKQKKCVLSVQRSVQTVIDTATRELQLRNFGCCDRYSAGRVLKTSAARCL